MVLKRIGDIVLSLIALIVLFPFMILVCFAIIMIDRQAPIFVQKRLTKNGKIFNLYKFQSMLAGTEEEYTLTLDQDSRITKVGKFIRRYKIDEIPQLVNVIKGDMSLVGPRPERPHLASEIEKELPEFANRLQVKAGLTGYAQIHGPYDISPKNKLEMDMYYIRHWSVWLDIKIMIQTIRVILRK